MVLCYGGGLAGGLRVGRRKVAEGGGQRPGEQGSGGGGDPRKGLFQEIAGPWEEVREGWQKRPMGQFPRAEDAGERG